MVLEEALCNIKISKSFSHYTAKIQTELGGLREYRGKTFEGVLEQMVIDLQEEFEDSL